MRLFPLGCLLCLLLAGGGCKEDRKRTAAIGEAYAGPATLGLRQEINPGSAVVTTVKHGERLEIVRRRRRFLKVRTEGGAEGWTDEHLLLSAEEIAQLKNMFERAASMPSQGMATTYDLLNIHTAPNRQSPSFMQVKEGSKMEVLGHRVTPRASPPPKKAPVASPKPMKAAKKEEKKFRLPMPPAPKPPDNWVEMSKSSPAPASAAPVQADSEPVAQDDWSLVRTASGQAGWVLTRRLFMAIPDEVAQYAEGRRITSYFRLGEVRDGDQVKYHWLWTTINQPLEPHDFDSFRVFLWSLRRHRYETSYIDRKLKGYYPVLLHPVEYSNAKTKSKATWPGFSVCLEKKDGRRYRRRYAFLGNIVRFAGEAPCEISTPESATAPAARLLASAETPQTVESLPQRLRRRLRSWFRR